MSLLQHYRAASRPCDSAPRPAPLRVPSFDQMMDHHHRRGVRGRRVSDRRAAELRRRRAAGAHALLSTLLGERDPWHRGFSPVVTPVW
jgi:hypothetical protein